MARLVVLTVTDGCMICDGMESITTEGCGHRFCLDCRLTGYDTPCLFCGWVAAPETLVPPHDEAARVG